MKTIKVAILERDPRIADNRMVFKRSWMPVSNPSSYTTNNYVWSPEVSTAYYIKKYGKNIDLDLITWETITDYKHMKKYDKVFIFNHGLSDIVPFWKDNANKYINAWKHLGNKVWPTYNLAEFVMDKCKYYKYLQNKNIPTAETYCVKTDKQIQLITNKLKKNNINKIFVKPVGGNSGTNTSIYHNPYNGLPNEIKRLTQKYPKVVIQRYMNFSTEDSPEYKCIYVGHKLQYIIKTHILGHFLGVIKGNDKSKKVRIIKSLCLKVINAFEDKHGKLIMCRVDVAFDNKYKRFFVNELEHAPGTYGDDLIHYHSKFSTREWKFDSNLALEIINSL